MNQHVTLPAPYLHDRWEEQVELEKSMLTMGADRMRSRIAKAQIKRDMTRLRPYRSLLKEWVLPVAEGVREWIARAQRKRGVRPIALPRMQELEPEGCPPALYRKSSATGASPQRPAIWTW